MSDLAAVKPGIGGVVRGGFPWWLITEQRDRRTIAVVAEEEDVLGLADDVQALFKLPSEWGPPPPFPVHSYTADDDADRQVALHEWMFPGEKTKAGLLISSIESLGLPCDPPSALRSRAVFLKPGLTIARPKFEDALARAGYSRSERAEQVGEYSVRGDVIDIWPAGREAPLRVTWNFDTVEALRVIDPHTQRSEDYLQEARLHPVVPGEGATLEAYLDGARIIFFSSAAAQWPEGGAWSSAEIVGPSGETDEGFEPPPAFAGNINRLRDQLMAWHDEDWNIVVYCHNRGERDRLEELLRDPLSSAKGIRPPWFPTLLIGELEHGFLLPKLRRAVLANAEIFGRYRKRVRLPKFQGAGPLASPLDVKPNDYLVHEKHGIGRYMGLKTLKIGRVTSEYLQLEYKGGDKLYVPIFELQQVQKYLGAEGHRPALSSLDTASWDRLKAKVQEDVAKLAADLLKKAAKRAIRPGHAFPQRTKLEDEFAASFMYKLTPDQQKTLEEVERDMTAPKAMDRLICGDVGYGKTEIAMRAALKAALAGKQVAVLCPTTILAEQHFRNFSERFADYPVTTRLLSRFQDKSEQKQVIETVAKGGVDIVIGTHRLLSADIHFPNLGLLIIDEEHRFGVKQKSKLLSLRETVDVLSLTATPIPRTLASSLSGIKDLSVIETPPEGRLPISTHVGLFNEDIMSKAVQQELDRGGQVFYVHNRVKTLEARKKWLEGLLPSIRIAMAHGQMNEGQLEETMHKFLQHEVDVLLATTIIESGLDIPSVNTLIVEEAEEMGLAQLYQLRGRVGRSKKRAYCFLFYATGGLTTDAKKRLDALKEF
ncbi:MAG: DEAD/DEAH box helicase, partial [Elusimicrobia bacterium]|nr:DEAD/DEAH box helicase [Elusimicrobiota bacterium]